MHLKKIAVAGTGVIGTMMGGFLAKAGYDVTVISQFRKDTSEHISRDGITVKFNDEVFSVKVNAGFSDELKLSDHSFDILLLTGKSNDTELMLKKMLPFLKSDGLVISLQNGINEDVIIPIAGYQRVIPCVCFAGGILRAPGYVETHDGRFIIGELDGSKTERVKELAQILGYVKPVTISDNIMKARWGKLAEVCLTVPASTVSGLGLFAGFDNELVQRVFARLACENFAVASGCGIELSPLLNLTFYEWRRLAAVNDAGLAKKVIESSPVSKSEPPSFAGPGGVHAAPADAYTSDMKKGLPLELDYINGYVINKGKEHGIDTPTHTLLVDMIHEMERKERPSGIENLKEIIQITNRKYSC